MKLTKAQKISIKVIMLFTIAIFSTFIPDYLHPFFGDWQCSGSGQRIIETWNYQHCNYGDLGFHESTWHWGYRHWLYLTMCVALFIIQVIDIVESKY